MNSTDLIVGLTSDAFQEWIKRGVYLLRAENRLAELSITSATAVPVTSTPHIFVALPGKYADMINQTGQVYALIDEIRTVSLRTAEDTAEWRHRLHNLGETWLPFDFRELWFSATPGTGSTSSPEQLQWVPENTSEGSRPAESKSRSQQQERKQRSTRGRKGALVQQATDSVGGPQTVDEGRPRAPSHVAPARHRAKIYTIDPMSRVIDAFDQFAGAAFGIAALEQFYSLSLADAPLVSWLLASEALVREDDSKAAAEWLMHRTHYEFESALDGRGELKGKQALLTNLASVCDDVRRSTARSWIGYLAPILAACSIPGFSDDSPIHDALRGWGEQSGESEAVIQVLSRLLREEKRQLYDPSTFRSTADQNKYAAPASCVVVKLGMILKDEVDRRSPFSSLYTEWRKILRSTVYPRLLERVRRGFAPEYPRFEELVMSLLFVAEWRLQPDLFRVVDLINSYQEHPDERMSEKQIAFCGALFGWLQGYRRIGNSIADRRLRCTLSEQAMAIATKYATNDFRTAFYATEGGQQQDIQATFVVIHSYDYTYTLHEKFTGPNMSDAPHMRATEELVYGLRIRNAMEFEQRTSNTRLSH